MKLNHRQRVALQLAVDFEPYWINAGHLSSKLWNDARERGDEDAIRSMRYARDRGSGFGRTLSVLAGKGLLRRRFVAAMAHHEYSITPEGKKALEETTP